MYRIYEIPPSKPRCPATAASKTIKFCLFGAVLAYVLIFHGISKLPLAVVSLLGLLSPICVFVLGWLFLNQTLDIKSLIGLALALLSIFGVQRVLQEL